ncbi:MAG: peptide chain release factor N(5)-glutamine methyltransferase [Crocinitomicaceae bacterium]
MFVDRNQLSQLLPYYHKKLGKTFEANEIEQIFFLMAFLVFGLEKIEIRTKTTLLSESELLFQKEIINRLLNQEPIEYIIGKVEFYDLILHVSPVTLIPRPETAELVDLLISNHPEENLNLLDIGTGSGCIPLAIKSIKNSWQVAGVDISKEALDVATINSNKLNLSINWIEADILKDNLPEGLKLDIIVSNPPYVLESDKQSMHDNVLKYEPSLALFVPDEKPLLFYNRIINLAKASLKKNGTLYFEIHENFGSEVLESMNKNGFISCEIVKDLQGKDRIVFGQLA